MDSDVVEIPPPTHKHPPRFKRHKKHSIVHDVIDIFDNSDNDDDDLMVLGEISRKRSKGKALEAIREGYCDQQVVPVMVKNGTVSVIQPSNDQPSVSHDVINVDSYGSDPSLFGISFGTKLSSMAAPSKKISQASPCFGRDLSNSSGVESSKSLQFMKSFHSKVKSAFSGSKNCGLADSPDAMKLPHGESGSPWFKSSHYIDATPGRNGAAVVLPDLTITDEPENETLRKLQSFKQFDTSCAKKIQEEWRILEKHLPVCESRMDLLRAVIIGAEGTPYHDGLFFFDVHFPTGYPNVPPLVHYHSRGLRLNPNLYGCGKVCLSLLNTWSGDRNQMWAPGVSTMLQVLVSIKGLILNAKPYYNEPGYEYKSGSRSGEQKALQYNEDTFILSLRTMISIIKSRPKNFEDLVVGHFYSRAHDILGTCKAYMEEGVRVGCFFKELELRTVKNSCLLLLQYRVPLA
ncbi:ubiquitin-conjugating enzyme [Medicago truncatula]|uniref:Ubiquitin-conjugating enzyme n=1 Tax=Medicago truncatula TaxID=3880 RepID=A0A072VNN5_MEDTR|nr:ubiquitin-conjugating enzyme [Medicago truncatula]